MTTSLIARTGRVQQWIDDPNSRLPVSCTVFVVEDSMEGPEGIEASWRFASHALRFGAGCAIHLSKLRPKGAENGKGLTASGPVSFAKIYSTLNEIIRRGGHYKNGAIVCHLDLNHDDVLEFITASRSDLPWVKRCVNITPDWWEATSDEVIEALLTGIKKGDIWLNKVRYDDKGNRIYGNVCLEVYLPSRELACCSTLISVPVLSQTCQTLSLQVCPSCAHSIARRALDSLVSTCHPRSTDKLDSDSLDWLTSYGGTE